VTVDSRTQVRSPGRGISSGGAWTPSAAAPKRRACSPGPASPSKLRATRRTTELSSTSDAALPRDGPAHISLHAEAAFRACPLRSGSENPPASAFGPPRPIGSRGSRAAPLEAENGLRRATPEPPGARGLPPPGRSSARERAIKKETRHVRQENSLEPERMVLIKCNTTVYL
jgi:hypothetical protein